MTTNEFILLGALGYILAGCLCALKAAADSPMRMVLFAFWGSPLIAYYWVRLLAGRVRVR